MGFAVPINTAKRVKDELIAKGEVEYAWMGVVGRTVDADSAAELGLAVDHGALVEEVLNDGPSDRAGIKKGDVIIALDGREIKEMEDVTAALLDYKPGDKVKVKLNRNGEEKEVEVELGKRPQSLERS